jgi:hypothetical protein
MRRKEPERHFSPGISHYCFYGSPRRIRTATKGLTGAPIQSQSCRYQESRDDLIDPLAATVHAGDSSRGSHRPPMSRDCRLLVGASAGAPYCRGGNLLIIIRCLRCECEGYTAHHPKTFRDVQWRPLRRRKSLVSLAFALDSHRTLVFKVCTVIQISPRTTSRLWGPFWGPRSSILIGAPKKPSLWYVIDAHTSVAYDEI